MGSVKISQTAQCPCEQDIVLSGKILLITSNLPSLCMHSMIWHESYIARTSMVHFILCYKYCMGTYSGIWPFLAHQWQLYPGQTLAYHSWAIWVEPDFQWIANGVLQFAWKVLCGKVFPHLPTILLFLQATYWTNAAIANIIQMARVTCLGSSQLYYS